MNNGINPITNVGDDSAYNNGANYNNGYNQNNTGYAQNESVTLRANTNTFTDVSGDQVNIAEYVNSKGLMIGTGDSNFNPNGTVTRAQMVQTLYAMAGKPPISGDSQFSDVSSDKWYNDAINWAQSNGIVAGYTDGSFKPDKEITRQEMMAIMNKYATYCGENTSQNNSAYNYSDASKINGYAVAPISWGVEHGMISESFSNLRPNENATRMEMAQMLMRYDQDYNNSTGRSAHVGAGAANMEITDVAANRAASASYNGNVSSIQTSIAEDAASYAGKLNYVYGGESLETGADCSGFVQAIYKKHGINISRTTTSQMNDGVEVPGAVAAYNKGDYSLLQPGDLIICEGTTHVTMYIGDGKVVHSPDVGKQVTIQDLNGYNFKGATAIRRIIQ